MSQPYLIITYAADCISFLDVPLWYFYHFFFFNDTATTEIYTLSLHDALPICPCAWPAGRWRPRPCPGTAPAGAATRCRDRKSTRLNSSHLGISYAVFCLKKKKKPSAATQPYRLPNFTPRGIPREPQASDHHPR